MNVQYVNYTRSPTSSINRLNCNLFQNLSCACNGSAIQSARNQFKKTQGSKTQILDRVRVVTYMELIYYEQLSGRCKRSTNFETIYGTVRAMHTRRAVKALIILNNFYVWHQLIQKCLLVWSWSVSNAVPAIMSDDVAM